MRRLILTSLVLLGVPSTWARAEAQADSWVAQGRRALQQGPGGTFERNGYRLSGDPRTGSLANADSVELTLDLGAGAEYKLVGACDANCADLNLTLFDAAGTQVDIDDFPEDNAPIVTVSGRQGGQYRLRVIMAACSRGPCRFAVAAYGR